MTALTLVAGVARNGVIGAGGRLPWHLPADLAHFRRVTMGHTVIMGRRTWDSLPAAVRPLPGRRNIVVTRQAGWQADGAEAAASAAAALALLAPGERGYVIGGVALYAATLALADELLLTEIDADPDGDVHFPPWDRDAFIETAREAHAGYAFVRYLRRN